MKKIFLLCLIFLSGNYITFAQGELRNKLFDDSQVARIDISMASSALDSMYQYPHSDSVYYCNVHFKNKYIDEDVNSVAIRVRGNTSRDSYKKSIKLDFNDFVDGRYFYEVSELNINGEHNDPTIMRSKFGWDFFQSVGLTSSKCCYADMYINGKYFGLYAMVENINKAFLKISFNDYTGNLWKCLYPADLIYKSDDPDAYKLIKSGDGRAYDLNTNETADDYTELARLIKILNKNDNVTFTDSFETIFDVTDILKYMAVNVILGSWDDYWVNKNNYYLYQEPSSKKFHILPYDYDNTLGVDWFGVDWTISDPYKFNKSDPTASQRPLVSRILNNYQYLNLYTHYLDFYNKLFTLDNYEKHIDSLRDMIVPSVMADTFRTKDYGFTTNDFFNSYSATGYSNQHVKTGLKEYITKRHNSLTSMLSYKAAKPFVYNIKYSPVNPSPNDTILIEAYMYGYKGVSKASLELKNENNSTTQSYDVIYSPIYNTTKAEDIDRWVAKIPPLGKGFAGSLKISTIGGDGLTSVYPVNPVKINTPGISNNALLINELMAKNTLTIKDDAGEYEDWLEIYNTTNQKIDLSGKYLTDKKDVLNKFKIPDSVYIAANGYLIFWCDEDGSQGKMHTNFKFDNAGEFAAIVDSDGVTVLDSITFPAQTADISYGRSVVDLSWTFFDHPTPGSANILTDVKAARDVSPFSSKLDIYPNPFNSSAIINYALSENSNIKIVIYNILGKEVWTSDEGYKKAGEYKLSWRGIDKNNSILSSGIYFCTIKSDKNVITKKLVLLK